MSLDMPAYLASRRTFLANRAAFPVEDLAKYAGQWVAWSPDGTRSAASAPSPELLDGILEAHGEDPARCVVEGISDDDALLARRMGARREVRLHASATSSNIAGHDCQNEARGCKQRSGYAPRVTCLAAEVRGGAASR